MPRPDLSTEFPSSYTKLEKPRSQAVAAAPELSLFAVLHCAHTRAIRTAGRASSRPMLVLRRQVPARTIFHRSALEHTQPAAI